MSDMGGEPTSRTILPSKTQRIWRTPLTRARGDGWRGRSAPGFGEGDDFRRGGVQVREKADAGFFDPDHGAETLGCGGERPFGPGRAVGMAGPGEYRWARAFTIYCCFTTEKSRRATAGHRSRSGC